jgi:hypothetical protein
MTKTSVVHPGTLHYPSPGGLLIGAAYSISFTRSRIDVDSHGRAVFYRANTATRQESNPGFANYPDLTQ